MIEAHRIGDLLTISKLARIYLVGLGAFAICWSILVLPTSWREPSLDRVANGIIEGKIYKISDLLYFVPLIDNIERSTICRPASMRSAAIVRLRLTEEKVRKGEDAGETLDRLIGSIRASLKCGPADPFLWVVLYWAETTRNGFDPRFLDYLRTSYNLGPFEGWVALKRSPIALGLLDQLPPPVAEKAIEEFVGLVHSAFYRETAHILVGPGWYVREKILPRLAEIPMRDRIAFEREVYELGYDIKVPGVEAPKARFWRR